jgi:putative phage-type endonuclease
MIEQGSVEWHQQRLGKVTASRISDVVARTKTGWGASRANYAAQLIAERLTGAVADSYTNGAMQWGQEKEAEAADAYAFYRNANLLAVGFVDHPEIAMSGASPDRLIGDDGLIEIKCPNTATHIETLLGAHIPTKYMLQMQWQMDCTGRAWCDFVSYDPRMPEHMRLHVERVERDDNQLADLRKLVREFLSEIDAKERALQSRFEAIAAE